MGKRAPGMTASTTCGNCSPSRNCHELRDAHFCPLFSMLLCGLVAAALMSRVVWRGVQVNTQRALRHAVAERVAVVVVINKVDRLITELKLPPADAYHKLRHTLEEVNALLRTYGAGDDVPEVDPVRGNVVFAAANAGWSFSLQVRQGGREAAERATGARADEGSGIHARVLYRVCRKDY
jgi:translation elongation factor EF-G